MSDNPFVWPAEAYAQNRDYNVVKGAFEDAAHYLSTMTGDDYNTCLAYVKKTLSPGGAMGMKDPQVKILHRDNGTDRERGLTTFTGYLKHVIDHDLLMAPTMTVYAREEDDPSALAGYTDDRVQERKIYKKRKFEEGQKGNETAANIADSQQSACKTDANSLSGAHNSEHNVMFIKTAHSTLTSTCRSATAYANANNEKFVQGNRHYWKPDVVYNNIATICTMVDLDAIAVVCERYRLAYPTTEQTMACIRRGSEKYWTSPVHMDQIATYVDRLSGVERAAFLYVGDFYHLAQVNPQAVRAMFDAFIQDAEVTVSLAEADAVLDRLDDDLKTYLSVMLQDPFRGRKYEDIKTEDPDGWRRMAAQVLKIQQALTAYRPLIEALWATPAAPASVSVLPDMLRRTVIAGDTDSTIFTVQWWVEWYTGKVAFDPLSYAVGATVVYFTSQMTIHLLAMLSSSMGVSRRHLFRLAMKNEFCFPVFVPTNRSKHYFAYQLAQEGNVFKELKLELKGAELRSAQTPPSIKKMEIEMVQDMMHELIRTGDIDADAILHRVAEIEHHIQHDIRANSASWFRTRQIKDKETYTNPYSSIWQYYEMWNEVFGPKYGEVDSPPYMAVSFKVLAGNKSEIQEWLNAIDDVDVRQRLKQWLVRRDKKQVTEIMLPQPIIEQTGVPDELISGANLAKVIYNIMSPFYIILESLGFYFHTKPFIQLVSDRISKDEVEAYFKNRQP